MTQQKYSDIDMNLRINPVNGDILRLGSEQSIKQSVRNLVLIQFYEKHFRPKIGNFASGSLFELLSDTVILNSIRTSLFDLLREYEPRIEVEFIDIGESKFDENTISVFLQYKIIGLLGSQKSEIKLIRVR